MLKLYVYPVQELCPEVEDAPLHLLAASRQKKIQAMKHPAEKQRGIAAGLLLRKAVQEEGILYEEDNFCTGKHGKPELKTEGVFFNLSHAKDLVVCAVADAVVGVDVECLSRFLDDEKNQRLARRILQEEELKKWNPHRERDRLLAFWTRKESYVKMTGDGLAKDFRSVNTLREGMYTERSVEWQSDVYRICVCTPELLENVACDFSRNMLD